MDEQKKVMRDLLFASTNMATMESRDNLLFTNSLIWTLSNKPIVFRQLYDRVPEGEAPSASNVMQFFTSWYGKDEEEEVFGEDSEFDENRKVRRCSTLDCHGGRKGNYFHRFSSNSFYSF